ncbi:MAG: exodeoxyribonuclease VII large subunit [Candidatus Binatia bacterium]
MRASLRSVPPQSRVLTVGELARLIQGALEGGIDAVWVVGEISNFRAAPSGHFYFTLKDDEAQLAAVLFRSAAARVRFRPADGLQVVAGGRIRLYEARGTLQLYVDSLEPRGLGALRLQLQQLRDKLEAEGLLALERKRPLPFLPRCVGVVTALGGAAIHDILTMLRARLPNLRVIVRPVRVQGAGAEREIADGIRDICTVPEVEVLIVGRGGGSSEDLWAFNDEGVARAIVGCSVPVVSAVGHEIDVTIADLVADARAPTPTAAAELVVPRRFELERRIEEQRCALDLAARRRVEAHRRQLRSLRARLRDPRREVRSARVRTVDLDLQLRRAARRAFAGARESLITLEERLSFASPARRIGAERARAEEAMPRLLAAMRHRCEIARERTARLSASLSSLSPLAVLDRGYAVVWKEGAERPLRAASEVAVGDRLRIELARGRLRARVEPGEGGDA